MLKIRTIINKEWAEVFKNRLVLFTVLFMPLLFTLIPLLMLYFTRSSQGSDVLGTLPEQITNLCQQNGSPDNCFQYYLLSQFIVLFMLLPVIIPVNIAAYSIVGEKTTHSLEPLLATPITTAQLLIGKNLAAALPAILATWVSYTLFALGAYLLTFSVSLIRMILDPLWLIAVLVIGPLLSILAVNFAIMVSSRVTDPRVAEQLSVVVILPILLLMFGQIAGIVILNRGLMLLLGLGVLVVDAILIPLAINMFQRESILTRWK
jgi:ABC-2 type transport system permease protein